MAVRSTTARRLATVIVATATVSALGSGAAFAASKPAPSVHTPSTQDSAPVTTPITIPPLSLPQVEILLHNLLGTVDGLLGDQLGVRTSAEIAADKDKPLLGRTVDNLTKTTKSLPVLGGVVGGLTDGLGLSEPTKVASHPSAPQTATPSTPAKGTGKHHRVDSVAPAGVTWTAPMVATPTLDPAARTNDPSSPGRISNLFHDVTSIFPASAAEAAAAGAGAATIALIVLGGIAVTGAAGAASTAGRRGLINGSVGGSL